jgi:anti-sigma regulatory factor (Ser/Thr protein kinase)
MVKPNKMVICMGDDWAELTALTEKLTLFFRTHQNVNMINPVNLLLEELYSNTLNYGQCGKAHVTITLEMRDHELLIQYEDNGLPFNPFEEAKQPDLGSTLEERAIGGLGIHFIKNMTDSQQYERLEGINKITLRKSC